MADRIEYGNQSFTMRRFILAWLLLAAFSSCTSLIHPLGRISRARVSISSDPQRREALRRIYENLGQSKDEELLPYAEGLLAAGYPEVEDYVLYAAGQLYARTDDSKTAERQFNTLLRDYPQSVLAERAALRLGQLLQADGFDQKSRPWFERALSSSDRETHAAALVGLGRIAIRIGDVDSAYRQFQAARHESSGTAAAKEATQEVQKLRAQSPSLEPRGSDAVDEVKLLLTEGDGAAAEKEARRAAAGADPETTASLRELLGRALLAQGRSEEAFVSWWDVVEKFPNTDAAPEALYRVGSTLWNRDRDEAAARAFHEFLERYPNRSHAADSLYALGRIEQASGRIGEATALFRQLLQRYPTSTVAYDAEWRIGWIAYQQGDWQTAATDFATLADHSRNQERDGANYWRARANEHAGRSDRARQLYADLAKHDGYYSWLANNRLRQQPPTFSAATISAEPDEREPSTVPAQLDAFHIERWRELRAAELRELARGELDAVASSATDPAAERFLLQAYQVTNGHARAIRMVQKRGGSALSGGEYREVLYPLAFWSLVHSEADSNQVDPLLVLSVMRQESLFDPSARSPANACGLMQLLPSTANRVSMLSEGRQIKDADLFDPRVNVRLGARYLHNLVDKFGGNVFKAVAAYNGGESAVEKWQQRIRADEVDEFVESISYRETREYVKRVMGNYDAYRRLYTAG